MDKTEFEIIYGSFMEFMEESQNYAGADQQLIAEYKGVFMSDKDKEDIIIDIWKEYGFCSYKNGFFTFLNPKEYNDIARRFPDVSDKAEVFARTATGCLLLWEEYNFGKNITFLNVHSGHKKNRFYEIWRLYGIELCGIRFLA
ncbi:GAD-like domain-containing protein [Flavobacterium sp. DGU11]|uniref:GAD-like domain-containing protein n=1 Tax=Flavobacterium arundinis TaxID=3139143 RepID=A0ABU9HVP2_9FLAO